MTARLPATLIALAVTASGCTAAQPPVTPDGEPTPPPPLATRFAQAPGSPDGRCVRAEDYPNIANLRSGGFVAGNFVLNRQQGARAGGIKIYWIPLHNKQMPGLTVRTERLTGKPWRNESRVTTVATAIPKPKDGHRFYPWAITIPGPGTYRLTGVSGSDKACFVMAL